MKRDDRQAFEWWMRAARAGSGVACCRVGECYELGRGVEANAVESAKWFIDGAKKGHVWGMEKAGDFYASGYGVKKDISKAREWYERAVRRNDSKSAASKLGMMNLQAK